MNERRPVMEPCERRTHLAGGALAFNIRYDASLDALTKGVRAHVKSSVAYVAREFAAHFANRATINLTVAYDPDAGLAASEARVELGRYKYPAIRAALLARSPGDATDLPKQDPTHGGTFSTTSAQAKILGLPLDAPARRSDGTVYFGKGPWTFAPDQKRKQRGAYDFAGSIEHEVSELMGRTSYLDADASEGYGYMPLDLFRYRAPGVRSFSGAMHDPASDGTQAAPIAYFSLDGGKTNLRSFAATTDEDVSDWQGYNHDAFDAEGGTSDATPITTVGLTSMAAMGYTPAPAPKHHRTIPSTA